jgi:hypothetical protein
VGYPFDLSLSNIPGRGATTLDVRNCRGHFLLWNYDWTPDVLIPPTDLSDADLKEVIVSATVPGSRTAQIARSLRRAVLDRALWRS